MAEALELITAGEMRELLRAVYGREGEGKLPGVVARGLRDPALALGASGRARPHPLWLAAFLLALVMLGSFVIFTGLER